MDNDIDVINWTREEILQHEVDGLEKEVEAYKHHLDEAIAQREALKEALREINSIINGDYDPYATEGEDLLRCGGVVRKALREEE